MITRSRRWTQKPGIPGTFAQRTIGCDCCDTFPRSSVGYHIDKSFYRNIEIPIHRIDRVLPSNPSSHPRVFHADAARNLELPLFLVPGITHSKGYRIEISDFLWLQVPYRIRFLLRTVRRQKTSTGSGRLADETHTEEPGSSTSMATVYHGNFLVRPTPHTEYPSKITNPSWDKFQSRRFPQHKMSTLGGSHQDIFPT